MDYYQLVSIILTMTALLSYLNYRYIHLPSAIGMMVLSLFLSLLLVIFGRYVPALTEAVKVAVSQIDFQKVLLDIMLSFLLFSGAIHIDAHRLRRNGASILILASVGILISTLIIGTLLYFLLGAFNAPVDYIYCLLFGALISPTDPIAVLGILKESHMPESIEMKITGESLFNDGLAIVVFVSLMHIAQQGVGNVQVTDVLLLFSKEVLGGLVYGAVLGYCSYYLLTSVESFAVKLLLTLAMVTGGYQLAQLLHVSAPISIVTAGILTANKGKKGTENSPARAYLAQFWEIIDNVLNAILFVLIGLEMLVVDLTKSLIIIGGFTVIIVLVARFLSVLFPFLLLRKISVFEKGTIPLLTWGGLRGGISVAIALSLPQHMYRDLFVTITYVVVVFSIVCQGLTIGKMAKRLLNTG